MSKYKHKYINLGSKASHKQIKKFFPKPKFKPRVISIIIISIISFALFYKLYKYTNFNKIKKILDKYSTENSL